MKFAADFKDAQNLNYIDFCDVGTRATIRFTCVLLAEIIDI